MKILKKILGFISLVLILGGAIMVLTQYLLNKQLLEVLVSNSIVKGSIDVLKRMGFGVLGIIAGLVFLSIYFKVGSVVRRNEKEKKVALKEQQREKDELNKQLLKEAQEAKAEAEQVKKENELMKQTFMRKPVEEETAENNNTENEEQA